MKLTTFISCSIAAIACGAAMTCDGAMERTFILDTYEPISDDACPASLSPKVVELRKAHAISMVDKEKQKKKRELLKANRLSRANGPEQGKGRNKNQEHKRNAKKKSKIMYREFAAHDAGSIYDGSFDEDQSY